MTLFKDLLYNKDNQNLEISRLSSFLAVIAYLALSSVAVYMELWEFDPTQWGIGWAGVAGGSAAWIFARQRYEAGITASTEGKG